MTPFTNIYNELRKLKKRICCLANSFISGTSTQSGDGVTDTFTITHGLDGVTASTPFTVMAASEDAGFIGWATIDATNINIMYGAYPPIVGVDNLTWNYQIKL